MQRHADRPDLSPDELEAELAAELPDREAMTLIDTGMLAVPGGLPGADGAADPSQLTGDTSAGASQTANQSATNLADLSSRAAGDAAAADAAGTESYQPAVSSIAQS